MNTYLLAVSGLVIWLSSAEYNNPLDVIKDKQNVVKEKGVGLDFSASLIYSGPTIFRKVENPT